MAAAPNNPETKYVAAAGASFRLVPGKDRVLCATPLGKRTELSWDIYQVVVALRIPMSESELAEEYDAFSSVRRGGTKRRVTIPPETIHALISKGLDLGFIQAVPDNRRGDSLPWRNDHPILQDPLRKAASSILRSGGVLILKDALDPSFAEATHEELDMCENWAKYEGRDPYFHYSHHNIYDEFHGLPQLSECLRTFGSPATKALFSELSGRDCSAAVTCSASWYMAGDYSLPHKDAEGVRQLAFVWHLTKNWDNRWGGDFYWCEASTPVMPSFNTLILFNVVDQHSSHFVAPVAPWAMGKRLAVNGWWNRAASPHQEASLDDPVAPQHAVPSRVLDREDVLSILPRKPVC